MTFSPADKSKPATQSEAAPHRISQSDPAWLSLRREIEQSVTLEESCVQLAGRQVAWFGAADPDQILSQAAKHGSADLQDPFWAASWRAARGLDLFLGNLELTERYILELGCGSGQIGMSVALRGGLVTMTDAVELALSVARLNTWSLRNRIVYRRLVWDRDRLAGQAFPIILGSDIVYDANQFSAIEACVRDHLSPSGTLYIGEPHRASGDLFSRFMLTAGWRVRTHSLDLRDNRSPIRIFECDLSSK